MFRDSLGYTVRIYLLTIYIFLAFSFSIIAKGVHPTNTAVIRMILMSQNLTRNWRGEMAEK